MAKKRVWIVGGGESAERDVSVVSARTIFHALDPKKYEKELIWISPQGQWIKKHQTTDSLGRSLSSHHRSFQKHKNSHHVRQGNSLLGIQSRTQSRKY